MACNTRNETPEAPISISERTDEYDEQGLKARVVALERQLAAKSMEMVSFRMEVAMLERIDALIPLYRHAYPSRRGASRSQMMRDFMEYGVNLLERRLKGEEGPLVGDGSGDR